jgi:hypothetical protein
MIGRVQDHLEAIYGLQCAMRADDFLVGPEVAKALGASGRSEELLISESDGSLEIALYICPDVLKRFEPYHSAPAPLFLDGLLGSYCLIAEGVSHFVYLVHTAELGRRVSLLELEAQAEVDKFATGILYGWSDGVEWARAFYRKLFDNIVLVDDLSDPEVWRYGEANRLAKTYCRRLLPHVTARRMEGLLSELRYSYRLGAEAKLQYFAQAS